MPRHVTNVPRREPNRAQPRGNYPPCPHCRKLGHAPANCYWRPDVLCTKCHQKGHVERVCKQRAEQRQTDQRQGGPRQQANIVNEASDDNEDDHLFVATCLGASEEMLGWVVDSGCSNHMSYNEGWFSNMDKNFRTKVKIGNGSYMNVEGRGDVVMHTSRGNKIIQNVLYIPSLCENLLSVGQLLERNYTLTFSDNTCTIVDSNKNEVFKVAMKNKSFRIDLDQALSTEVDNMSQLWHKRLGHSSYKAMKRTYALVKDMPQVSEEEGVCDVCQQGKQTRLPFSKAALGRAKAKLELIHSDVCGPMSVPSLQGCRYFLTFIDDHTRMCWVYFLKNKSQVAEKFDEFRKLVENQSGCTLKCIRSDNGGEYTGHTFQQICRERGIIHQFTTPYTPQQNGVSERRNRTIMEMARCFLFESKMPKKFWAEAVYTSTYIQNRIYSKTVGDKTPFELWHGHKPSLEHLKVFGSICYLHVPEEKRDKLDTRAQVGVLVGYSEVTKGFRVYNIETRKLLISRDVKINEEARWDWSKEELQLSGHDEVRDIESDSDVRDNANNNNNNDACDNRDNNSDVVRDDEDDDVREMSIGSDIDIGDGKRGARPLSEIYERCNVALSDPTRVEEAFEKKEWREAMKAEMEMIEKNATWSLVTKPRKKHAIGVKWIFRTKYNPDGSVSKHKARLVVKGYAQQAGVDYGETFAPVARMETIRLILALSACNKWKVFHLDVKSAFLNGVLKEEVYVQQPEGFVVKGSEEKVYKLHKALYGLKQAPRAWYGRIDGWLLEQGFRRSQNEPTLYVKSQGSMVVISLYVDDLLVTGRDIEEIEKFTAELENQFEMSSLGEVNYFLGVEVTQCSRGIFISQEKYINDLLKKFNMDKCNATVIPMNQGEKFLKEDGSPKVNPSIFRSLIGSLLYVCSSRPDVMYAVCVLSRYMQAPSQTHYEGAKRILRYLKGTSHYGVWYESKVDCFLHGFSDSDWAGCGDDMKSTSGYLFTFGSGPFSWNSKKQSTVAQSTAEAEYIACSAAANQCIWLRKLMKDLGDEQGGATIIKCDNTSAISIAQNPVQHGRTKHIPVKYHSLREFEANGEVKLVYVRSEDNISDIFTKPLPKNKFEALRDLLNVSGKISKEEC